jgi:hypothetical protein
MENELTQYFKNLSENTTVYRYAAGTLTNENSRSLACELQYACVQTLRLAFLYA